ncbi:hypothetical protein BH09BAC3_BH09BAC3_11060 [soil metagenome]
MQLRSKWIVAGIISSLLMYSQTANSTAVHIHGIALDSTVTYLKIIRPSPFWWSFKTEPVLAEVKRGANNSSFDLSFQLDKPVQLWLISTEETWPIFCTPGDDVSFVIQRNPHDKSYLSIKFEGENSAQYNMINELQDLGFRFSYPVFRGDPLNYRSSVDKWLSEREKVFDAYRNQLQANTAFVDYFNATIAYSRLNLLYIPLWNQTILLADLPANYFNQTENLSFSEESLLDNTEFRGAVVAKYICGYGPAMWDNFDGRYNMITSMKSSKIKEYLIAFLNGLYAWYESPQYEDSLRKSMQEAQAYVQDPVYREFVVETQKNYLKLKSVFPDSVQNNTFLISIADNKKITLKEMLSLFKKQAIYVNFWEPGCVPCREDINASADAKVLLTDEKVSYVYISIDNQNNQEKWREASEKDGTIVNQFLLVDGTNSPLGKYLRLDYVPRYMLIDEAHTLRRTNSPRPISSQLPALTKSIKEMRMK